MQEIDGQRYRDNRRDYTNVVNSRSASPPAPAPDNRPRIRQQKKQRSFKKPLIYISVLVLVLVLIGGVGYIGWSFFKRDKQGPFLNQISQSVNFPLYYPSSIPSGYSLDKSSEKSVNQIVFYNIVSPKSTVNISEQAVPQNPPDFAALQKMNTSFKKLDVIGGSAIYGVDQKVPVAFLITNTTMINVNGDKNTPIDVIAKLIQNMSSTY